MRTHAQVLGGQEVPVELVRHILSFLVGHSDDGIAPWVRTTSAVCQLWRSVSLDLVRDHTARLWSSLPLPHPDLHYANEEKGPSREPMGAVMYMWRRKDDRPGAPPDWADHHLVAISEARDLPVFSSDDEDDDYDNDPYYRSSVKEEFLTAGQVWSRRPWAELFTRFVSCGCSSPTFDATDGPVASVVRLLLFASDARPVMALCDQCQGGAPNFMTGPWITTDYADVKLFITIRSSAEGWLLVSPPAAAAADADAGHLARVVCVHFRSALRCSQKGAIASYRYS